MKNKNELLQNQLVVISKKKKFYLLLLKRYKRILMQDRAKPALENVCFMKSVKSVCANVSSILPLYHCLNGSNAQRREAIEALTIRFFDQCGTNA